MTSTSCSSAAAIRPSYSSSVGSPPLITTARCSSSSVSTVSHSATAAPTPLSTSNVVISVASVSPSTTTSVACNSTVTVAVWSAATSTVTSPSRYPLAATSTVYSPGTRSSSVTVPSASVVPSTTDICAWPRACRVRSRSRTASSPSDTVTVASARSYPVWVTSMVCVPGGRPSRYVPSLAVVAVAPAWIAVTVAPTTGSSSAVIVPVTTDWLASIDQSTALSTSRTHQVSTGSARPATRRRWPRGCPAGREHYSGC